MTIHEHSIEFSLANSSGEQHSSGEDPLKRRSYALLNELRRQQRCERCGDQAHVSNRSQPSVCRNNPPKPDNYILNVPLQETKEVFAVPALGPDDLRIFTVTSGSDGKDRFSSLPDELVKRIFGFYMVAMPIPQRQYPVDYQVQGLFDDKADALEAIRYVQKHDERSHLATDILQKWIPAYVEESRRHMLHKFSIDQATATSKELLSKIHEPYASPYFARCIAIEIQFDIPTLQVNNIQEADLDSLKEFLGKFDNVETATVKWQPQHARERCFRCFRNHTCSLNHRVRLIPTPGNFASLGEDYLTSWFKKNLIKRPKMREFHINDGPTETVTPTGGVLAFWNEKAKTNHAEHVALFWTMKKLKKEALARKTAGEGN